MATEPIRLDGCECGAQVLTTALTLSLVTRTPFSLQRLAAPGLGPELLGCVRVARAVGRAEVRGAELGARELEFEPGPPQAGAYLLDAGSIPLALPIAALPLSLCAESSSLTLTGATHLPGSPALHFTKLVWLPAVQELGFRIDAELSAAGWSSEGGGEVRVEVRPRERAAGLERRGRGTLREARVLSAISNVPLDRATRQSARALQRLREGGVLAQAECLPIPAPKSAGSMCLVAAAFERGAAGFYAVGGPQDDPEAIAEEAVGAFLDFMRGCGGVDPWLADQNPRSHGHRRGRRRRAASRHLALQRPPGDRLAGRDRGGHRALPRGGGRHPQWPGRRGRGARRAAERQPLRRTARRAGASAVKGIRGRLRRAVSLRPPERPGFRRCRAPA